MAGFLSFQKEFLMLRLLKLWLRIGIVTYWVIACLQFDGQRETVKFSI